MKAQRGFFKIIVVIVILFVLNAYLDLDLRKILESNFIHNNWANLKQFFAQVLTYLRNLVNYLTDLVK